MRVIKYEDKYRDDMIFMVLSAKNSMGQVPRLNNDLLDVISNYLDEGDMFWLALDDNDRVIGSLGFNRLNSTQAKIHRFFVRPDQKITDVGSSLLSECENYLSSSSLLEIVAHNADLQNELKTSFSNSGYVEYQPCWVKKAL